MTPNYIHDKKIHNTNAAQEIVPLIIKRYMTTSVIDIGCGTGTWGKVFIENGVTDYIGVDGDYVNMDMLMIDEKKFISADLTKEFSLPKKFDLALSLEVAEHLPESSADIFVKTLVSLSDTIIFSAAIQGQGGQNHLNEQFPLYWKKKFENHNYYLTHNFSPDTWNNENIEWWYQQNIFVYQKKETFKNQIDLKFGVHPVLYKKKLEEIAELKEENRKVNSGLIPLKKGLKIFIKSALNFKKN